MGKSADLNIKVNAEVNSAVGNLTKLAFQFNMFTQAAQTVTNALGKLASAASDCVRAYDVQQKAEIKLAASIRATGNAIGVTSKQMKDMASQFQAVTTYGDETVIAMQSIFIQSQAIARDSLPRVTEAALDMASALGTDATSAAQTLTKAMAEPEQAARLLRSANVFLSDSVEEQIRKLKEQGDLLGAQQIILEHIEGAYGGLAKSIADTDIGKLKQTANAWGDIKEDLGNIVLMYSSGAINFLSKATEELARNVHAYVEDLKDQKSVYAGLYGNVSTKELKASYAELDEQIKHQMEEYNSLLALEEKNKNYAKDRKREEDKLNASLKERSLILQELKRREEEAQAPATDGTTIPGALSGSSNVDGSAGSSGGSSGRPAIGSTAELASNLSIYEQYLLSTNTFGAPPAQAAREYSTYTLAQGTNDMSNLVSSISSLYSTLSRNAQSELAKMKDAWTDFYDEMKSMHERDKELLKAQLDSGIMGYEEYKEAVTSMYKEEEEAKKKEAEQEEKLKKKADKLAEKAFYANQVNSFANATISGAQAIMRTWAEYPYYVAAPLTAVLASTTALQQATIMQQKYTGLATGGIVDKPTHIYAGEGEGPEAVIPLSRSKLAEYGLLDTDKGNGGAIYLTINVSGTDSTPEAVFRGIERAQRQGILPKWRYA